MSSAEHTSFFPLIRPDDPVGKAQEQIIARKTKAYLSLWRYSNFPSLSDVFLPMYVIHQGILTLFTELSLRYQKTSLILCYHCFHQLNKTDLSSLALCFQQNPAKITNDLCSSDSCKTFSSQGNGRTAHSSGDRRMQHL